ncbi:MAG: MarR family transcriptional regulator [Desulfobacterales bacterium]|nr:MarR family transcriptional regulator [Desulfobacterales bacterium]
MKLSIIGRIGYIYLTWSRFLQKQLLPHDITLKQIYLLKQLIKTDYLYPADIADILFCDRPTVSVIIRNLVKKEWIEKQTDLENRKRIRISITLAGAKKLNQVTENGYKGDKTLDLEKVLTIEEISTLENLLSKVQKSVQNFK